MPGSVHEDEVDGEDEADEGGEMVPVEGLPFEEDYGEDGEYEQCDRFLNHF